MSCRIAQPCLSLIDKAIDGHFVIPDFAEFTSQIDSIYSSCADIEEGRVCLCCENVCLTRYFLFIACRLYPTVSQH